LRRTSLSARSISRRTSALVRLEIDLALREVRRKALALGIGAALLAAAGLLGLLMLVTGLAAAIAAIALVLPVWAAILVVSGGLFLLSTLLGVVGLGLVKRGAPPVPEQALEEARLTREVLQNGRH
jgi:hypothetical protein